MLCTDILTGFKLKLSLMYMLPLDKSPYIDTWKSVLNWTVKNEYKHVHTWSVEAECFRNHASQIYWTRHSMNHHRNWDKFIIYFDFMLTETVVRRGFLVEVCRVWQYIPPPFFFTSPELQFQWKFMTKAHVKAFLYCADLCLFKPQPPDSDWATKGIQNWLCRDIYLQSLFIQAL